MKYKHLLDAYVNAINFERAFIKKHGWIDNELSEILRKKILKEISSDLSNFGFQVIGQEDFSEDKLDCFYIEFNVRCKASGKLDKEQIQSLTGNEFFIKDTDYDDEAVSTTFTALVYGIFENSYMEV